MTRSFLRPRVPILGRIRPSRTLPVCWSPGHGDDYPGESLSDDTIISTFIRFVAACYDSAQKIVSKSNKGSNKANGEYLSHGFYPTVTAREPFRVSSPPFYLLFAWFAR